MAITTTMVLDYNEEKEEFVIIDQIVNVIKKDENYSSDNPNFLTLDNSDSSIRKTINKISLDSSKELYTQQLQLLILSENIVNNHLDETLDYFMRSPDIRDELRVVLITNDNLDMMKDLLKDISPIKVIEALDTNVNDNGVGTIITVSDLTDMHLNPYKEIILPTLYIDDEKFRIGTTAIFKDNKYITLLGEEDNKYFCLLNGNKKTNIEINYKDGYIILEPYDLNIKKKIDIKNNTVNIYINGFSKICEISSNVDIQDTEEIKNIERVLNNNIKDNIINSFNNVRDKYNTDIYGFRDLYYKKNINVNNWYSDVYPKLKLKVKANIKLYENGNIKETIKYEKEYK